MVGSDGSSGNDCLLEASRDPTRKRLQSSAKLPSRFGLSRGNSGRAGSRGGSFSGVGEEAIAQDFGSKLLHLSWHPTANVIATAASNSLYLFYGESGGVASLGCQGGSGEAKGRLPGERVPSPTLLLLLLRLALLLVQAPAGGDEPRLVPRHTLVQHCL